MLLFNGLKLIENILLTVPSEDWSQVRSPSRAIRRRKQGYRQNIRYVQLPDPKFYRMGDQVVAHPETMRELMRQVDVL